MSSTSSTHPSPRASEQTAPPLSTSDKPRPKIDPEATPSIELINVSKRLRSGDHWLTILDRVDLRITPGEFVAIVGPSGSGKSTLLGLIAGLDRPSEGQVLLDGIQIQDLSEDDLAQLRARSVGFVFQSFELLPHLTARENIRLPLDIIGRRDAAARTEELLQGVELIDRGHHYPSQLSGGEKQRIAVARAFATAPPILLADEPTGNLDRKIGLKVLALLDSLRSAHGTTLVFVTHDPALAARADRTITLEDGRVQEPES